MDDEIDPLTEDEARESLAIWRERNWRTIRRAAILRVSIRRSPSFIKRINLLYVDMQSYYIGHRLEDAEKRVSEYRLGTNFK